MTVLYRYALDPSSSRIRIVCYSRPDDCGKDKSGRFERGNICGGVREGRERTLSAERTRRTVEKARGLKTQKLQAERFGPVASSKPRAIKLRPKDQLTKAAAEQERRAILAREHANKVRKEADFTFWEPSAENLERRHAEIFKADQGAKTQREMADRALKAIARARAASAPTVQGQPRPARPAQPTPSRQSPTPTSQPSRQSLPPPAPVATAPAVATAAQTPQPQPQPQARAPRRTHLERLRDQYNKLHDDYHAAFIRSRTAATPRGADAAKEKMAKISRRIREIREQIDELAPSPEGRSWSTRHGAYWTGD